MPVFHAHVFGNPVTPAAAEFLGSIDNTAAQTVYSETITLSRAAVDEYIVVIVGNNSNARTTASVTVDTQSCTVIQTSGNAARGAGMAVTDAPLTTGTTVDVVVTLSGADNGCAIAVYGLTTSTGTPADSFINLTTDGSDSLAIPANGCAIVGIRDSDVSGTITGVTKDVEQVVDGSVGTIICGSDEFTTAAPTQAISWNTTGTTIAIGAAWGP